MPMHIFTAGLLTTTLISPALVLEKMSFDGSDAKTQDVAHYAGSKRRRKRARGGDQAQSQRRKRVQIVHRSAVLRWTVEKGSNDLSCKNTPH